VRTQLLAAQRREEKEQSQSSNGGPGREEESEETRGRSQSELLLLFAGQNSTRLSAALAEGRQQRPPAAGAWLTPAPVPPTTRQASTQLRGRYPTNPDPSRLCISARQAAGDLLLEKCLQQEHLAKLVPSVTFNLLGLLCRPQPSSTLLVAYTVCHRGLLYGGTTV